MNSNDILCPAAYALMCARKLLVSVQRDSHCPDLKRKVQDLGNVIWNAERLDSYICLEVGVIDCFPPGEARSILLAARSSNWCIEVGTRYVKSFGDAPYYEPLYVEEMLPGLGGVVSGNAVAMLDSPVDACNALYEYEDLIDYGQFWLMGDDWWKPHGGWKGAGVPPEITRVVGQSADR